MNNNSHQMDSEHLQALLRVSSTLNSSLDLDDVLDGALTQVLELLKAERGLIMLEENGELTTKAAKSFLLDDVSSGKEISHGVIDQVFKDRQPVLTVNAMDDNRFSARDSVIVYQLRSVICVPLKVKEQVIGVIYLDNRWKTGIFSKRDLETLVTFANHAAIAIENARLYKNLKDSITEKLKLQEEVYQARLKVEIERETNQLREDLVHYLIHDLRNPLTVVNAAFTMLQSHFFDVSLTPEEREIHERAETNIRIISKMLSDILDVFLLENHALVLNKEKFDIMTLCRDVLDDLNSLKEEGVEFRLNIAEQARIIFADRSLLLRVISNLIQNACKWTKNGYISLKAETDPESNSIAFTVDDTGPGIPAEYRERIFSKFIRVERQDQPAYSRGLGLAFCRLVLVAHMGQIKALENPDGGSRFVFKLPVHL